MLIIALYRESYTLFYFPFISFSLMNLARVFLSTLQIFAIFLREVPFFNSSDMSVSLPESLYFSGEFLRGFL